MYLQDYKPTSTSYKYLQVMDLCEFRHYLQRLNSHPPSVAPPWRRFEPMLNEFMLSSVWPCTLLLQPTKVSYPQYIMYYIPIAKNYYLLPYFLHLNSRKKYKKCTFHISDSKKSFEILKTVDFFFRSRSIDLAAFEEEWMNIASCRIFSKKLSNNKYFTLPVYQHGSNYQSFYMSYC